jgi:hypothetical protein
MYDGIPFELGSEGVGHPQFTRELYAALQQREEPIADEEQSLNMFMHDMPFNFAIEQVLESLEDPGISAKVARLCTLVTHVPVYAELAQAMQELSNAVHKFQKYFNDKTSQVVIQLKATKQCMEAANIPARTQAALFDLACSCKLQGRFYWPHIPGILENPRQHYL